MSEIAFVDDLFFGEKESGRFYTVFGLDKRDEFLWGLIRDSLDRELEVEMHFTLEQFLSQLVEGYCDDYGNIAPECVQKLESLTRAIESWASRLQTILEDVGSNVVRVDFGKGLSQ